MDQQVCPVGVPQWKPPMGGFYLKKWKPPSMPLAIKWGVSTFLGRKIWFFAQILARSSDPGGFPRKICERASPT